MTGKVGFVGLGIMGRPMARNLLAAGYELVVHNRSRGKAEGLAEEGASVADNPKEVAGENGVFEGVGEGALLVDMSTISPVVAKELAAEARERGASMLDAPVSGGEPGAEAGTLSIMVGVDPAKVIEVLSGGMAGNKVMEVRGEKFLKHEFDPGFKLELHRKDLGIALAAGREYGVPLPVTGIVDQVLEALVAKGLGAKDHSAILTFIEDLAQHTIIGEGS